MLLRLSNIICHLSLYDMHGKLISGWDAHLKSRVLRCNATPLSTLT